MIPDAKVEEVRERADIVGVIGEFVPLQRSGKDYKALCPFHEEKTPSFYVVPSKGFYKCFGCGESGDVFSFLMERQGMDFVEAVKHVGRRSGVEVKEVGPDGGGEDPHRHLYEVNGFARRFYRDRLEDPDEGERARRYLEGRGIDAETAERYGLGYAPAAWRALREAAARHDIDDETLFEAGLLNRSERASEPYDRFRDRIVFPIELPGDRVVGFGGRILGEGEEGVPKYLNSPETPIYHKGEVLYGLPHAKRAIRREEAALVVEGYMDAVALGAAGLEHVVAPLGTSVTDRQARLLGRYCTRVYLLFDSDSAGLRATFRAADVLLEAGLHPAVVTLPPGEDPDSVVRSEGAAGIQAHLDRAVDVLDRKLQILDERDYFSSIERTRDAVDRLLPTLRAASDPALRDIYVAKVADRTGVRRETLEAELDRAGAEPSGPRRDSRRRTSNARRSRREAVPKMGAERDIVRILLRDPEGTFLEEASEKLSPDDFDEPTYRRLYEAVLDGEDLSEVKEGMEPRLARTVRELRSRPWDIEHPRRTFEECVNALRRRRVERKIEEERARLRRAAADGDEEEVARLRDVLDDLAGEARSLGRSWKTTVHKALRVSRGDEGDG